MKIISATLCFCLTVLFFSCSDDADVISRADEVEMEVREIMVEYDVSRAIGFNLEECGDVGSVIGSDDFTFSDGTLRIRDRYYLLDRLVKYRVIVFANASDNTLALFFN